MPHGARRLCGRSSMRRESHNERHYRMRRRKIYVEGAGGKRRNYHRRNADIRRLKASNHEPWSSR
jgi:hypothetical protein